MSIRAMPPQKAAFFAGLAVIAAIVIARSCLWPSDRARIERILRELAAAVENKDSEYILKVMAEGFALEDETGKRYDRDQVERILTAFTRYYKIRSIHFEEMRIELHGARCVARFRTTARWSAQGVGSGTHDGEWRADFVRRGKTWKLEYFQVVGEGLYF